MHKFTDEFDEGVELFSAPDTKEGRALRRQDRRANKARDKQRWERKRELRIIE